MVDLGTLGGPSSAAAAVNDSGQVVGWAQTAGAGRREQLARLSVDGSGMMDLGSLGGIRTASRGM